jgi:hypothetical protein
MTTRRGAARLTPCSFPMVTICLADGERWGMEAIEGAFFWGENHPDMLQGRGKDDSFTS